MRLGFNDTGMVVTQNDQGETLIWNTQVFDKSDFATNVNLFRDINNYWAQLTPDQRLTIWNAYKGMRNAFDTILDSSRLAATLIKHVQQLYSTMSMDKIGWWADLYGNIVYPPSSALLTEHDTYDQNPGRTYIRSDYAGLVYLTIALRPMLPIWGEYLRRTRADSGTEYKEYVAMYLLSRTGIINSAPMERMRVYADALIKSENKKGHAHVMTGLGTEETVEWMVSRVCIRRLTVVNIDAHPTAGNIITNIHGFVTNTLRDLDRNFGGRIRNKKPEESVSDDETSMIELYKVKQSVSMGDIEMYSVYCSNTDVVAQHLDPTVPLDMVAACVQYSKKLESIEIQKHHLVLTQWVTRFVIPPEAVPCLSKIELLGVMGVVQALLWHWGFIELAAFMTATPAKVTDEEIYSLETRQRITNDSMEKLMRLYPHLDQSDKQKGSERKQNFASQSIAMLAEEMSLNLWQFNAPPALTSRIPIRQGVELTRRTPVPANIMELLAHMVIYLAEKENA